MCCLQQAEIKLQSARLCENSHALKPRKYECAAFLICDSVPCHPPGATAPGWTQDSVEGLHIPAGVGAPRGLKEEVLKIVPGETRNSLLSLLPPRPDLGEVEENGWIEESLLNMRQLNRFFFFFVALSF